MIELNKHLQTPFLGHYCHRRFTEKNPNSAEGKQAEQSPKADTNQGNPGAVPVTFEKFWSDAKFFDFRSAQQVAPGV